MLDPTHPDVAKVLHLLDPCDVCGGNVLFVCSGGDTGHFLSASMSRTLTVAGVAPCPACDGHGKALHPDRAIGALRRYMLSVDRGHVSEEDWSTGDEFSACVTCLAGHYYYNSPAERVYAYCRAAADVMEAASV